MIVVRAIAITIGILIIASVITPLIQFNVMLPVVIASAIGILIDMKGRRIPGKGFPKHPVVAGICVLLLWIIAFPWYLAIRE